MWNSYHIYRHSYKSFLLKTTILKQHFPNQKMFFTVYSDMYGPHFRLRLMKNKQSVNYINIKKVFGECNVLEKIYDPEIIKYKDNLIEYEKFSVLVCDYIINESCFSDRERIESCLIIIKYIFSEINNFSVTFLEKCFDYWGNMSSYFTNSLDLKSLLSKPFNDFDNDKFRNYLEYSGEKNLSFNINGDNKDQLTFNLIHMTVNRHNFNPLEERSIYKYLIGELKKYDR